MAWASPPSDLSSSDTRGTTSDQPTAERFHKLSQPGNAPIGVLLCNLGTPKAPTAKALRPYLRQFLSDRRVIDVPRWTWWLLLNFVILPFRPAKSARLYKNIWTSEGSPLLVTLQKQSLALQSRLEKKYPGRYSVEIGMRYGCPCIFRGLKRLRDRGCHRILVLPLYPQYSCASTASTIDAVSEALKRWRDIPEIRFVKSYYDHPIYIEALAESIKEAWADSAHPPAKQLLFSFHGIPKRYAIEGDPYPEQCHATARLVATRLKLAEAQWRVCFQSRFGREVWLQPYTDKTLIELARAGASPIHILSPGFSADCLETLEELNMTNRELFEHNGGKEYRYIPALNVQPRHIEMMLDLVEHETGDWRQVTDCPQRSE